MFNNRGQIASTITWVVATIIVIVVLIISISVVSLNLKNKEFTTQGYSDLLVTKSFMGYLLSDDGNGQVFGQVKDKDDFSVYEKFPEKSFDFAKKIFIPFYNVEANEGLIDIQEVFWIGLVKENFGFQTGQIVGLRNGVSSGKKAGVKIYYGNLRSNKNVLVELVMGVKEKMKNKRADIPVTIFVLGVIAICGLAILSFIVSEKYNKTDELGTEVFEKLHSDVEKFEFYKNAGTSLTEAASNLGFDINNNGKLIIEDYSLGGPIIIKKYSPAY